MIGGTRDVGFAEDRASGGDTHRTDSQRCFGACNRTAWRLFVTLYSPALRRRADITLFVPPEHQNRALPLLILMHGVYGSHWNWAVLGNAAGTAMEMIKEGTIAPFAIAMPSDGLWGDGSGYVIHRDLDAESWIMDDVPACVRAVCPEFNGNAFFLRGNRWAALALSGSERNTRRGLPESLQHSPVTSLADLMKHVQQPIREYEAAGKRDTDLLHWMRLNREQLPPIRFDCGTEDSLHDSNRALHEKLRQGTNSAHLRGAPRRP